MKIVCSDWKVVQFKDYRNVDGVMVAFKAFTKIGLAGVTDSVYRHQIESVEFNLELDEEQFQPFATDREAEPAVEVDID